MALESLLSKRILKVSLSIRHWKPDEENKVEAEQKGKQREDQKMMSWRQAVEAEVIFLNFEKIYFFKFSFLWLCT